MPGARSALDALRRRGLTLAVAESFTGGRLMDAIVRVPGASRAFQGGVVAYADGVKAGLLGVHRTALRSHGAVSEEVAVAMARGVRRLVAADVGIATTGIAGPTGATPSKPIGLSIVAVSMGRRGWVERRVHRGGRATIQRLGVQQALRLLARALAPNG